MALKLAARGAGWVSPNPMVGAVVVRQGVVVGQGWHRRYGGPHAEVEALQKAGDQAPGSHGVRDPRALQSPRQNPALY